MCDSLQDGQGSSGDSYAAVASSDENDMVDLTKISDSECNFKIREDKKPNKAHFLCVLFLF